MHQHKSWRRETKSTEKRHRLFAEKKQRTGTLKLMDDNNDLRPSFTVTV